MSAPALNLSLPCPKCHAAAGSPCVRRDGAPTKNSHVRRHALAPCGTYGGYQRHIKAAEDPCDPCREANRRYAQARRAARPEEREADIAGLRARHEATKLLIKRHEAEFRALLAEVKAGAA